MPPITTLPTCPIHPYVSSSLHGSSLLSSSLHSEHNHTIQPYGATYPLFSGEFVLISKQSENPSALPFSSHHELYWFKGIRPLVLELVINLMLSCRFTSRGDGQSSEFVKLRAWRNSFGWPRVKHMDHYQIRIPVYGAHILVPSTNSEIGNAGRDHHCCEIAYFSPESGTWNTFLGGFDDANLRHHAILDTSTLISVKLPHSIIYQKHCI